MALMFEYGMELVECQGLVQALVFCLSVLNWCSTDATKYMIWNLVLLLCFLRICWPEWLYEHRCETRIKAFWGFTAIQIFGVGHCRTLLASRHDFHAISCAHHRTLVCISSLGRVILGGGIEVMVFISIKRAMFVWVHWIAIEDLEWKNELGTSFRFSPHC